MPSSGWERAKVRGIKESRSFIERHGVWKFQPAGSQTLSSKPDEVAATLRTASDEAMI